MRIEKITITNLTSIEGEQTVDFTEEPLRSAGLFAITGAMGSGKTTLLDAVALALYGTAPRFEGIEKISTNDTDLLADESLKAKTSQPACGLLRRGKKQGSAAVTFRTNDGVLYEATWSVGLNGKGRPDTPKRTLERLAPRPHTFEKAEVKDAIVRVLGLTYEQFTRTVLLAQGSFANFLQAKADEKAALLEKLTGTELFGSIGARIYNLQKEAEAALNALEKQREGILANHLSPEALREAEEQRDRLDAAVRALRAQQESQKRAVEWLTAYAQATERLQKAEAHAIETNRALAAQRADELRLERYDAVSPLRPLHEQLALRRADAVRLRAEEADVTRRAEEARHRMDEAKAHLDVRHERTADAEQQLRQRTPDIERGHTLNGEINEGDKQLTAQQQDLERIVLQQQRHADERRAKKEALAAGEQRLADLRLKRQQLQVHRQMFDKLDLVKERLADLVSETDRGNQAKARQATELARRDDLAAQSKRIEQADHDYQAQMATLQGELHIHRQAIIGRQSEQLQQTAAAATARLDALARATTLWEHIAEGYAAISARTADLRRAATEVGQLEKDILSAQQQTEAARAVFEQARTAYTLSQSENIVRLRENLREGTACPVCGATHHPYHTETERELGQLLDNLEKEYNVASERLAAHTLTLQTLTRDHAARQAALEADTRALDDLRRRQDADVREWSVFAPLDSSFADCTPTTNVNTRRDMLRALADSTQRTATEAAKALADYNLHQGRINTLTADIDALNARMNDNRALLDSLRTERRIAETTLSEVASIIALSDRARTQHYDDLAQLITVADWFATFQRDPDTLRATITTLHSDWTVTCANLDEAERAQAVSHEELRNLETLAQEDQRHVTAARDTLAATREIVERKREELQRLFGGKTPADESERLKQAITAARADELSAQRDYDRRRAALDTLQGQLASLRTTIAQNDTQAADLRNRLDLDIARFNAAHSPLRPDELDTLFADETAWPALRQAIEQTHRDNLLALQDVEAARNARAALNADPHRPEQGDQTDAEALQALLQETAERLAEAEQQHGQQNARLLAHAACARQAERLDGELQKRRDDLNEWKRLNTLFGSSDGKKFRTLAQSYTFALLIRHANHHLRQLCPRYALAGVPGTLLLEIIDHDMCDQHRLVSSLSGGETFVVSLALALALSSLSSGTLHIGTLFIDEGFGNLDARSLDLVMLALSNLESTQGRKVGIISHADAIREQIHPQVHLRRLPGSGGSVVEVG